MVEALAVSCLEPEKDIFDLKKLCVREFTPIANGRPGEGGIGSTIRTVRA